VALFPYPESEVSLMALTEKQKIFADEYLIDLNATRAYRVAYPSVKKDDVAAAAAVRLLRNVKVADYIEKRMQERQERTEITQDRVLKELAVIAFAKATDYAEVKNGAVFIRDTAELSEAQVRAIAGIKEGKFGIELKLNDKEKALELLGRHLGMFKDKVELSGSLNSEKTKLDDLISQMRGGG
jgi:phage terminase small subunit